MNCRFCSGAAGWTSVLRLAASAVLLGGAGLICAQGLGGAAAESQAAAAAIPADSASNVSNPVISVPFVPANAKADSSYESGFELLKTRFPAPVPGYFQSYRNSQVTGTGIWGTSRPTGGYTWSGGATPVGIAMTARFGFLGDSSVPIALPNFNQMMRANIEVPLASSVSTFKLTYRNVLIPGVNGGSFGQGTPGGMFSTTNLGNGVFFSAGTNIGKGSMAGTPPGGFGSNSGATGPKPSRPAVTLKLSF